MPFLLCLFVKPPQKNKRDGKITKEEWMQGGLKSPSLLVLQKLRRDTEAESALKQALALEAGNLDYLYALAALYLERGDLERARKTAEELNRAHPDLPLGNQLLGIIRRLRSGS